MTARVEHVLSSTLLVVRISGSGLNPLQQFHGTLKFHGRTAAHAQSFADIHGNFDLQFVTAIAASGVRINGISGINGFVQDINNTQVINFVADSSTELIYIK